MNSAFDSFISNTREKLSSKNTTTHRDTDGEEDNYRRPILFCDTPNITRRLNLVPDKVLMGMIQSLNLHQQKTFGIINKWSKFKIEDVNLMIMRPKKNLETLRIFLNDRFDVTKHI